MKSIGFYCDASRIEENALEQLQQYAANPYTEAINAFPDIHYCQEKALPVGVAFKTSGYCYPLITGKDIGCGVMYLRISRTDWLKPFDKQKYYHGLYLAHGRMTDEGLGGGNHFLSIEEDDRNVYIICHTGTRNRGIALYQDAVELTRSYSLKAGNNGFISKKTSLYDFEFQSEAFGYLTNTRHYKNFSQLGFGYTNNVSLEYNVRKQTSFFDEDQRYMGFRDLKGMSGGGIWLSVDTRKPNSYYYILVGIMIEEKIERGFIIGTKVNLIYPFIT